VEISIPHLERWPARTPVLVDDVISSGRTIIEACRRMLAAGTAAPVCLAVHALFAEDAFQRLKEVANRVVTTNTVSHESNALDVTGLVADDVGQLATGAGDLGRKGQP
jgi:ribose-phosphate pyrophosphokinase